MTTPVPVCFVTVTYNSADTLRRHWTTVENRDIPWVVVDNASTDDSVAAARELGASMVIELPHNVGFSAANNVGVESLLADTYVFVNPDVVVSHDGALALAALAQREGAIVAPQLLNGDGTLQENGRQAPYLFRKLLHMVGSKRSHEVYEITAGPDQTRDVAWVIGAAVAIPRHIFEAVRGWDSRFFIYYEDSDICIRARQQGFKVKLTGTVRWVHGWNRATKNSPTLMWWKFEVKAALRFYGRYPRLLLPAVLNRRSKNPACQDAPALT